MIENKVVSKVDSEFYMISQSVTSGTVNPTNYRVLLNERAPSIQLNNLQSLTFMLCHMYYNSTGQIKVPAPCHYAYKLAKLVGETFSNINYTDQPELQDKLFYI